MISAAACAGKPEAAEEEHAAATVTATVEVAATAPFTERVDAVGTVSARVGHVALLSAPAPTRVTKVHVALGDRVAMGAALVDLELPAFDAALVSAEAALAAAEKAAARAQRLVEGGVAPRKDAEAAAVDLEVARANAVTARRTHELAHVKSPMAGVVTRLNAVLGSSVDVGQPLVEVTDPSSVDVVLSLSPGAAARVRTGQEVAFYEGQGVTGAAIAHGRVGDVAAMVDSASRSVAVRVEVATRSRALRLGESLFGQITVARHAQAVVIPDEALVPDGEGFRVFVVDSADTAKGQSVTVGGRSEHTVWIAEGLKGGERIVTHGAYGLDDGAKVVPSKIEPPKDEPAKAQPPKP